MFIISQSSTGSMVKYYYAGSQRVAMRTLRISRSPEDFKILLILVEYNPHSTHLHLDKIASLPFARQIKIFYSGFAIWEKRLSALDGSEV